MKRQQPLLLWILSALALCPCVGLAEDSTLSGPSKKNTSIEIDSIVSGTYRAKKPAGLCTTKDGKNTIRLSSDGKCLLRYDLKTGQLKDTLLNVEKTRGVRIEKMEGFVFNRQENKILLWNASQAIYRRSFMADYFVYDCMHNVLDSLSGKGKQRDASFSPDGRMVAFARDNNLYIKKLDFKTEVAVTKDGKYNEIINGTADWAYEEEFSITKMYEWSVDSRYLCFVKFDEREVGEYTFLRYACSHPEYPENKYRPQSVRFKYPRSGEAVSQVSVYAYQVQYRTLTQLRIPLEKDSYIPRLRWTTQADALAVMSMNRSQNEFKMYYVNPKSNLSKLVLTERSQTYYDPSYLDAIQFTERYFTFVSERDGYRHLYLYRPDGRLLKQLTSGNGELIRYYGADTLKNLFYYQSVGRLPYYYEVCRSDSKGKKHVLSVKEGVNEAVFDSQCAYALIACSTTESPAEWHLYETSSFKKLRTWEDNAALKAKLATMTLPKKEFFEIKAADGSKLYAWMMKPSHFDASKKYPLVMLQYSGPDSQNVLDRFDMGWEYALAEKGYIAFSVDCRGTGGRGEAFRKMTYGKIGKYETEDQIATARELATLPYVDASRIAIWGWSYGGYITLLSMMQPDEIFKAGIAVAPVCDYRYYDAPYTERFMRTPQENAEGYDENSPLLRAKDLKGRLLLVHGLADDNVHVHQSMELADALIQNGIQFEMQLYPNRNHSILGVSNRLHLYKRFMDFIERNL